MCGGILEPIDLVHKNITPNAYDADMSNTTFFTNTQYFQRGLNDTQYQYQFFDESLTIPNTNNLKGP